MCEDILEKKKNKVRKKNWLIDELIKNLQDKDVWPLVVDSNMNCQDKYILCVALCGEPQVVAAAELNITIFTVREYCSRRLYPALTQLYIKRLKKNPPYRIVWNTVQFACEEMGYYK